MTIEEFEAGLEQGPPPHSLTPLLQALWWDGRGDFNRAHEIAQDESLGQAAALVHAYLHRKEGEAGNAAYWYRLAGRPFPNFSTDEEWRQLVTEFLKAGQAFTI